MTTVYPGALDSWFTKVDGVDDVMAAHVNNLQDAIIALESGVGAYGQPGLCEGRLTLQSGVAVPQANQTAKTVVYFTPYNGHRVALKAASGWVTRTFAETSVAVPNTGITPFDVFVYDNAGTPALETVNWTSDTARATAIGLLEGVWVKSTDTTRRYLGTGRTTGTVGQTEDSVTKRFLWNFHNRVSRYLAVNYSAVHTYNTATWRAFNNLPASCKVEFMIGVAEDILMAFSRMSISYAAGNSLPASGIGVNSTAASAYLATWTIAGSNGVFLVTPAYSRIGQNEVTALEFSDAAGTAPSFNDVTLWVTIRG